MTVRRRIFAWTQRLYSIPSAKFCWIVFVLALIVRLFVILVAGDTTHPMTFEHGDIAHNLYTDHGYAMHWPYHAQDPTRVALMDQPPQYESSYQPPVNPYLMFWTYSIFGETPSAFLVLMFLYSICNSLLSPVIYKTLREFAGDSSARTGALIAALFLPAAFSVTTFSGSPLYMVAVAIMILYGLRTARTPNWKNYLLLGMWCGISMLMRSEVFALSFVVIAAATILAAKRTDLKKLFWPAVVAASCSLAIIAPWTIRNYNLFHKFVPIVDRPWHEIWRGNNEFSTPSGYQSTNVAVWLDVRLFPRLVRIADSIPYDQRFVIRLDSVFRHEALTYMEQHPVQTVELGVRKVLMLLTYSPYSPGRSGHRLAWLYPLSMLLVTIPTLVGLIHVLRQTRHSEGWNAGVLYTIFLLYYCAISFVTFVLPRYQIYVFVVLIPMATIGWNGIASFVKSRVKHTIEVSAT